MLSDITRRVVKLLNEPIPKSFNRSNNTLQHRKGNVPWKGHSVIPAYFIIFEKYQRF